MPILTSSHCFLTIRFVGQVHLSLDCSSTASCWDGADWSPLIPAHGWTSLRHIEMKRNKNVDFWPNIVAFLSSRIEETELKLFLVLLGRGWNLGVNGCWIWECVRIRGQAGTQIQIGSGCGLGWSLVVCVWHWQINIFFKRIWWDWVWIATGRSEFDTMVVSRCPFIRSERERQVSPM